MAGLVVVALAKEILLEITEPIIQEVAAVVVEITAQYFWLAALEAAALSFCLTPYLKALRFSLRLLLNGLHQLAFQPLIIWL
jgi:hypothetical protein